MSTIKAYLNVEIDQNIKETAAQLLASMGLDHRTAIDMYYRQIIKERRLPFQPEAALTLEEQLTEAIYRKSTNPVRLECDNNGDFTVDREKHPEIHDWLVND